jgi:ribosomal protein S18 acetylase RimI-like enzyme
MLRNADRDDTESLIEMIRRYFAHDHIPFDELRVRPGLDELLATTPADTRPWGHAWIAEVAGATVGYAIVTFGFDLEMGGRFALLTDLYIHEQHRHRGLGMKMLAEIELRLVSLGIVTFELTVERANEHARALYRKAGFVARDRFPMTKRIA